MATKFAEFLETNQIDTRRLIAASRQLERLRPEDRALKLKQRKDRKSEGGGDDEAEKKKPRSGRTVTVQLIEKAKTGKKVSGAAKSRLVRAVNRILEQKKKDPAELRQLF